MFARELKGAACIAMEPGNLDDAVRAELARLYRAAVDAADPARLVGLALDGALEGAGAIPSIVAAAPRVFVLAIGKASLAMAAEIEHRLGAKLAEGLVVAPAASAKAGALSRCEIVAGGHPLPDSNSEAAASKALELLAHVSTGDLVIAALSGGASAMFAAPAGGLTLADKVAVTAALLRSAATIRELNIVRKHLSRVKGGRLVQAARGARVVGLVLSDVPGNDLAAIASGLTAPDPTTFADAIGVMKRRAVWGRAPERVRDYLERGNAGQERDTLKGGDPALARVTSFIIGDNRTALEGAASAAMRAGYRVERWRDLAGEADDVGRALAEHLSAIRDERVCVITGGEPVVTLRGGGLGGRAQQCALALAIELARMGERRSIAALVAGTDGIDGPTDAAGAFAFPDTVARGAAAGMRADTSLGRNDAYSFFKAVGGLFVTGPTGTNVADLSIALVNF